MTKVAEDIAYLYFAIPFDGDPATLIAIIDSELTKAGYNEDIQEPHKFQSMHGTDACWHCDKDYGQH